MSRRHFCFATAGAAWLATHPARAAAESAFQLKYIVSSAMYGTEELAAILPQLSTVGTPYLDIWPRPHGNQREQVEQMGVDRFADMLAEHDVKLGGITRYDLFPFNLADEMQIAANLGASVMVGAGGGPSDAKGDALRRSVADLAERMKPLAEQAQQLGLTLAVENHSNSRLQSPDGIRWFAEMAPPGVGIAFAPHHLPQDAELQAELIESIGDKVAFFYAQQHGAGSSREQPREKEWLQMPGRGPLDFAPLVAALKKVNFNGFTEIFMHPYPRGIPIADTPDAVTAEIVRAREYLDNITRQL